MSSWDQGEVLKLSKHGNDYAMKVWLANAPDVGTNGRPKEGDDINVFKRFIVDVYEKKLCYCEPPDENGVAQQAVATSNQHLQVANRASQQPTNRRPAPQPKKPAPPAPAPQQQPTLDLLDFGTFDNALPSVQPAVVEMTAAAAPAQSITTSAVQQPAPRFEDSPPARPTPSETTPRIGPRRRLGSENLDPRVHWPRRR